MTYESPTQRYRRRITESAGRIKALKAQLIAEQGQLRQLCVEAVQDAAVWSYTSDIASDAGVSRKTIYKWIAESGK